MTETNGRPLTQPQRANFHLSESIILSPAGDHLTVLQRLPICDLQSMLNACPLLKSIDLNVQLTPASVSESLNFSTVKDLRRIDFCGNRITLKTFESIPDSVVSIGDIALDDDVNAVHVKLFLERHPSLVTFELNDFRRIESLPLFSLVSVHCPVLQKFKVRKCGVDLDQIYLLKNLRKFECLRCVSPGTGARIDDEDVHELCANNAHLEKLLLKSCTTLGRGAAEAIASLKSLSVLCLWDDDGAAASSTFDDRCVEIVVRGCGATLVNLLLGCLPTVLTDEAIHLIAEHCPRLTHFDAKVSASRVGAGSIRRLIDTSLCDWTKRLKIHFWIECKARREFEAFDILRRGLPERVRFVAEMVFIRDAKRKLTEVTWEGFPRR